MTSITPTRMPAQNAPATLPKPPRFTTTNAIRMKLAPTSGKIGKKVDNSTPAAPAQAAPMPQAMANMRCESMPMSRAASLSDAVASSAAPSLVRCRNSHTAAVTSTAPTPATTCGRPSWKPARCTLPLTSEFSMVR